MENTESAADQPPQSGAEQAEVERMLARGYRVIEHDQLPVGTRVRNRGEQYPAAYDHGTAAVVAVMEKDPSSWTHTHGARDIEVLVRRDRDGSLGWWADYGTHTAREQPGATD